MSAPSVCPVCGEDEISPNMLACPNCGACENSGWKEDDGELDYGALGIGDEDDFDYDSFIEEEFGTGEKTGVPFRPKIGWLWWTVAVLLLLGMIGWWLGL